MTATTLESFLRAAWKESFSAQRGSDLQFTKRVDRMMEELAENMVHLALTIRSRPRLVEAYAEAMRELFTDKPDWFGPTVSRRVKVKLQEVLPSEVWEIVQPHIG